MRILLFIYTLLGFISLSYTKVNDTLPITINFDENGKIIGTLPNYIKPGVRIILNYPAKDSSFYITKMKEYKDINNIKSLFTYENKLKEDSIIYLDISATRFFDTIYKYSIESLDSFNSLFDTTIRN